MAHESQLFTHGADAPPFTLPTQKGEPRALSDYLAAGPVLLAFHRGTW
jgi:peroxiredoxin